MSKQVGVRRQTDDAYAAFSEINGIHSLRQATPGGYVDYRARRRPGGNVFFFNFGLAKEMGLIPKDHPHRLTPGLAEAIVDTFGIVIINEYDILHGARFNPADIKPHSYMATRYLQLQHPGKLGTTSGDGRGIWNGELRRGGVTWDISSSGTGATCLSPATAREKKFFKTGDPRVCYGSGYNHVEDGLSAAVMSEVLHRSGVATERTLAIIEFQGGTSVNVRASRCLLRPSHVFSHLKQGNLDELRSVVDYYIDRRVANGDWPKIDSPRDRYHHFVERIARSFAEAAARFESEYIFCWMAWDGDNILMDGGIIDYGSIRQFGLFHSEYRYDDVERWSTKLTEQKAQARYIVQTFVQIREYLLTGKKRSIRSFSNDPALKSFDRHFESKMDELLLRSIGLDASEVEWAMKKLPRKVRAFREVYRHFERTQSKRGVHPVPDGVSSDAIFCMRDGLREFPRIYLAEKIRFIAPERFVDVLKSKFALKKDLKLAPSRIRRIGEFQKRYLGLLKEVAGVRCGGDLNRMLLKVTMRSSVINRSDRITGDGVLHATDTLLKARNGASPDEMIAAIEEFIRLQKPDPSDRSLVSRPGLSDRVRKAVNSAMKLISRCREGI